MERTNRRDIIAKINILGENKLEVIHEKSLEVLREVGVKVEHEKVYNLLLKVGAKVLVTF